MHELGLCEAVVDSVRRHAGDREVAHVRVRVGVLHRVDPAAFAQLFQLAAAGTVAAAATTDVVAVPVHVQCRACGAAADLSAPPPACAECGGDVDHSGGDELVLESIEYRPAPQPAG